MEEVNIIDQTIKDPTPKINQQLLTNLWRIGWDFEKIQELIDKSVINGDVKKFKGMILNEWNQAIWNPLRKHPKEELSYTTDEENWNELSNKEKEERLSGKEIETPGFIDLNKVPLNDLVESLDRKYTYLSSWEAFVINKLITFYKENK